MKILLTGATGFIGYNLTEALVEEKHSVRALVRNTSQGRFNNLKKMGVEIIEGDLKNIKALEKAVSGAEIVFHLAGIVGSGIEKKVYLETHIDGTSNLLAVCRRQPGLKQFIFVSTIGVLGPLKQKTRQSETLDYQPTNIYEETKAEAEKLVYRASQEGLPVTIIRPGFVYGPNSLHFLQMLKAIQNKKFFLIGRGKNTLHPVYIEDLIQGLLLVLNNPRAIGQIYNLAGEEIIETGYFFQTLARSVGTKIPKFRIPVCLAALVVYPLEFLAKIFHFQPLLTRSRLQFFIKNRGCSIDKAKQELGYQPQFNFAKGLELTIQFYKKEGYLK